jgi:hypothetical protein
MTRRMFVFHSLSRCEVVRRARVSELTSDGRSSWIWTKDLLLLYVRFPHSYLIYIFISSSILVSELEVTPGEAEVANYSTLIAVTTRRNFGLKSSSLPNYGASEQMICSNITWATVLVHLEQVRKKVNIQIILEISKPKPWREVVAFNHASQALAVEVWRIRSQIFSDLGVIVHSKCTGRLRRSPEYSNYRKPREMQKLTTRNLW